MPSTQSEKLLLELAYDPTKTLSIEELDTIAQDADEIARKVDKSGSINKINLLDGIYNASMQAMDHGIEIPIPIHSLNEQDKIELQKQIDSYADVLTQHDNNLLNYAKKELPEDIEKEAIFYAFPSFVMGLAATAATLAAVLTPESGSAISFATEVTTALAAGAATAVATTLGATLAFETIPQYLKEAKERDSESVDKEVGLERYRNKVESLSNLKEFSQITSGDQELNKNIDEYNKLTSEINNMFSENDRDRVKTEQRIAQLNASPPTELSGNELTIAGTSSPAKKMRISEPEDDSWVAAIEAQAASQKGGRAA